jgi:hypothetical protein
VQKHLCCNSFRWNQTWRIMRSFTKQSIKLQISFIISK